MTDEQQDRMADLQDAAIEDLTRKLNDNTDLVSLSAILEWAKQNNLVEKLIAQLEDML